MLHFHTWGEIGQNPKATRPRDRARCSVEVKLVNMLQWRQSFITVSERCQSSPSLFLMLCFPLILVRFLFWWKRIIRCNMFPQLKSELGVVVICVVNMLLYRSASTPIQWIQEFLHVLCLFSFSFPLSSVKINFDCAVLSCRECV